MFLPFADSADMNPKGRKRKQIFCQRSGSDSFEVIRNDLAHHNIIVIHLVAYVGVYFAQNHRNNTL